MNYDNNNYISQKWRRQKQLIEHTASLTINTITTTKPIITTTTTIPSIAILTLQATQIDRIARVSDESDCISTISPARLSTSSISPTILKNYTKLRQRSYFDAIVLFVLIVISIIVSTSAAADSLLGDLQTCNNEGEEIQLQHIINSNCYKCACQHGFVNCDKESCPAIDDCYLLDPKSPETCCRRCRGCIFRGIPYASGSEWTDPEDPCKTYKCVASVVTETTIKCYTQCDDNQVAVKRPGECCPICQGCKINGQIVHEGEEVVASIDDRCLVCQCYQNRLTCAKKSCPILQCPFSKQVQDPNDCCPRCTEHREFMPVPGKCFFSNKVHYDRTQFMPDRCTNCTCVNGTSICQRHTCPILDCAPEHQEKDGCCARCKTSEVRKECVYNGVTYLNNETWNHDPCRSCRCTAGNIRCSEMRCPTVKCRSNEELKYTPGECCPKCVESAGTCSVFGDPHFKSFDGKFFSFQGSCKYLLTADCHNNSFSIRLTNDGRGTRRSSWPKTVTLKMKTLRINLGQKLRVKVNGTRITMPYSQGPILSIERLAESVLVKTDIGINMEWDGNNFLQVQVPSSYKRKLCGLCGNYNGIVRDDLTSRDGTNHSEQEVWRFANSWKVGGPKACSRKVENIVATPTCNKRRASILCRPLRESGVFGNCDNRLNPNNYIESCKMDVCECPTGMCHCDSFGAYAHECRRLGVKLPDWRTVTKCPVGNWRRNNSLSALIALNANNRLNSSIANLNGNSNSNTNINNDIDNNIIQQQQQQLLPVQLQHRTFPYTYTFPGGGGGAYHTYQNHYHNKRYKIHRPRKHHHQQQQQQHHHHSHSQQHNQLSADFITKHVPKNLLNRTPLPLH